jgi:ArsR family transcriptional regulator
VGKSWLALHLAGDWAGTKAALERVCELTEMVGADISTVSRHLSVLRQAGILASERRGQQIHYRLRTPCVLDFLGCATRVLKHQAKEHERLLAAL